MRVYKRIQYQVGSRTGTLPDYLIIGAQKCGTTSLYSYLIQHPCVHPATKKEIGFFDLRYKKGIRWYRSHFPSSIRKYWLRHLLRQGFITGEASTGYIACPQALCRICKVLPRANLILLLRNPVDRAYSHYQHAVRLGIEPLPFEQAIQAELERVGEAWCRLWQGEDRYIRDIQHYSYLRLGVYADQVQLLLDLFPREQLLILNCSEFLTDPSRVFRQTLSFLGIPLWEPERYDRFNAYSYEEITPTARKRLAEFYRPHNERLYRLIGVDFGWEGRESVPLSDPTLLL